MLTATHLDATSFHTRSRTAQCNIREDLTLQPKTVTVTPDITAVLDTPDTAPKLLTSDKLQALLQIQRTDPFCKCIFKYVSNGKAPKHEANLSLHIKGLLRKNMSSIQTRHSWLLSYLKHENTQCSWKHMTNLVTRELLTRTAL